jgi:predicted ArsR family transcriptional regulator
MTIEQQIYNGNRAKEVLDNEAFQQVFTDYKTEITEQWTKSPARSVDDREKLWLMLSLLNRLEVMLRTTLETGEMRKLDLAHEEKKRLLDKAKGWIGSL